MVGCSPAAAPDQPLAPPPEGATPVVQGGGADKRAPPSAPLCHCCSAPSKRFWVRIWPGDGTLPAAGRQLQATAEMEEEVEISDGSHML